jgi:alpha-ketoglutarate-dependent taurine dioxygenase
MSIEVIPTRAALGAEIRGINLAHPLDEATFTATEDAYNSHGVIFFRNQSLPPPQQVAFTHRFGELEFNIFGERWSVPGSPEIVVVSNVTEGGRAVGVRRAGENWHSDMCYTARPPRGTMLFAIEVPELHGLTLGDTEFASAQAAWEALPDPLRHRIEGQRAVFDFRGRKRAFPPSQQEIDRNPRNQESALVHPLFDPAKRMLHRSPVTHPIVRTHPYTGKKCLYIMRDDCTGIEGLEQQEAEVLIAALADHIVKPEFVYRHRWRPGDLLIWDNCTVQHRAIQDYELPHRRLMYRTTMGGTVPV